VEGDSLPGWGDPESGGADLHGSMTREIPLPDEMSENSVKAPARRLQGFRPDAPGRIQVCVHGVHASAGSTSDHVVHTYPGGLGIFGPDYGWNYDHKHARDSLTYIGIPLKKALANHGSKQTQLAP